MGLYLQIFLTALCCTLCANGEVVNDAMGLAGIDEETLMSAVLTEDCFGEDCEGNGAVLSLLQNYALYKKRLRASVVPDSESTQDISPNILHNALDAEDGECTGPDCAISLMQKSATYNQQTSMMSMSVAADGSVELPHAYAMAPAGTIAMSVRADGTMEMVY